MCPPLPDVKTYHDNIFFLFFFFKFYHASVKSFFKAFEVGKIQKLLQNDHFFINIYGIKGNVCRKVFLFIFPFCNIEPNIRTRQLVFPYARLFLSILIGNLEKCILFDFHVYNIFNHFTFYSPCKMPLPSRLFRKL